MSPSAGVVEKGLAALKKRGIATEGFIKTPQVLETIKKQEHTFAQSPAAGGRGEYHTQEQTGKTDFLKEKKVGFHAAEEGVTKNLVCSVLKDGQKSRI